MDGSPIARKLSQNVGSTHCSVDPRATEPRSRPRKTYARVTLLDEDHTTSVGTSLAAAEAEIVHQALKKNVELFA